MKDLHSSITASECAEFIRQARNVVALTGAGISTAAGIRDFRGPQGLYVTREYDAETIFDIDAFRRDPAPFYDFTRDFLGVIHTVEPTFTHRFLAELEASSKLKCVVTQNIDSLHQKAGSKRVIPIHGDYWSSHCLECGGEFDLPNMERLIHETKVPHCDCGGLIKPDVVFFGEGVHDFETAASAITASDLLLVLGSSLMVYPASLLPEQAGGDVVVVSQGEIGLPPGPQRFHVEADLDQFFARVAEN